MSTASKPPSLAGRAAVAIVLTIGFYLLALTTAGLLLWFSWLAFRSGRVIPLLIGLAGAGSILWALIPRETPFPVPGPQLFADEHPRLFALLREVARATRQRMPNEVYLMMDANAFVAIRHSLLHIGERTVLVLGVPLLQLATLSQLRAILAHELGHYHHGDVRVGAWVYKTRETILRTTEGLSSYWLLQQPFIWYARLFLRVTQAISREQELAADRLAAKIAGARNAAEALTVAHRAGIAHGGYWANEVTPLLESGFRPPIIEGFARFLAEQRIESALGEELARELREPQKDPYDSHPPLRERIRELKKLPGGPIAPDEPRAISLLDDPMQYEVELLRSLNEAAASALRPIAWSEALATIYAPYWKRTATEHVAMLRSVALPSLPRVVKSLPDLAFRNRIRSAEASGIISCALAHRLYDSGWTCERMPGQPFVFRRGEETIEPFVIVDALRAGTIPPDVWEAQCQRAGLDALRLGS